MVTFTMDGLIATESDLCLSIKNLISEEIILKECDLTDEKQVSFCYFLFVRKKLLQ